MTSVVAMPLVLALGRKEGFRLLRSPLPWIGVLLTTMGVGFREGEATVLPDAVPFRGLALFPMAGMVLVASTMATLRSRRHRTEELFATTPSSTASRSAAHAAATLSAGAVATVVVLAWLALAVAGGAVGGVDLADLLTGPVLVVSAGVTGVALARLVPVWSVAPWLVVAIGFVEGGLVSIKPVWNPLRRLAPWMPEQGVPTFLTDRPTGWHLVYLAGIIGVLVSIAMLRTERSRGVKAVLAASLAVALIAGIVQTRPMSGARAAEIADLVSHPAAHQSCEMRDSVRFCAYSEYAEQTDWWAPVATSVVARVRDHVGDRRLTVRQVVYGDNVKRMPDKVRQLLPPGVPRVAGEGWSDGAVHPSFSWPAGDGGDLYMALAVASWAVGLPPSLPADGLCHSLEQARGIVALWLAVTSTPAARAAFVHLTDEGADGWMPNGDGTTFAPPAYVATFPATTVFGSIDVHFVRELIERPDAEVWSVFDREWDRFVLATTSSNELRAALSLQPRPPLVTQPGQNVPACT